jgi:cell wall-associated NlpC family hydrolase
MMGLPYLWGGTSWKGVDCSGFTRTIYLMNGMLLPRDASQQVHVGKQVDTSADYGNLQPGDLLFFGRPATDLSNERAVHVGMWLGNGQFIHSSGMVRISSFNPSDENFDAYNLNRFLRAKRMIESDDVVKLKSGSVY